MTKTIVLNGEFESTRFEHDCERCAFLGQFKEYDLYFCPQNGIPTIVARWGNGGPEYTSGQWSKLPAIKKGIELAKEAGLL